MTSKEILAAATREIGCTQAKAAENIGWTPTKLSLKIMRNTLRVDELIAILNGIGVELSLKVKDTGREIRIDTDGIGPGAKGMVDKVVYDTRKSSLVASDFYSDGESMYIDGIATELYRDRENRYFFVEYYEDGRTPKIKPTPQSFAEMFVEKHGTEIRKGQQE